MRGAKFLGGRADLCLTLRRRVSRGQSWVVAEDDICVLLNFLPEKDVKVILPFLIALVSQVLPSRMNPAPRQDPILRLKLRIRMLVGTSPATFGCERHCIRVRRNLSLIVREDGWGQGREEISDKNEDEGEDW
jgi:hypothetical protein